MWRVVQAMHPGKRLRQEDAVGVWQSEPETTLFVVVADGAGGHGGGAEASTAAVAAAERQWTERSDGPEAEAFLRSWMSSAHEAVNREARGNDADARTVAVALIAKGNRADWAHAGDCRLYHIRNGEIQSRTRDDSVVQVLFEQGTITEAEMGTHEDQNRLLQALGGDDPPKARLGGAEIQPGDVLLLCSDGFWENLEPQEITQLAGIPLKRRQKALEKAVHLAVERGGQKADNTSVVMAGFDQAKVGSGWLRIVCFTVILFSVASLTWAALQSPLTGRFEHVIKAFRQWWVEIDMGTYSEPVPNFSEPTSATPSAINPPNVQTLVDPPRESASPSPTSVETPPAPLRNP
jgi:serine/threonine protein phosphatase PrpC